jgi:hypothetical protein
MAGTAVVRRGDGRLARSVGRDRIAATIRSPPRRHCAVTQERAADGRVGFGLRVSHMRGDPDPAFDRVCSTASSADPVSQPHRILNPESYSTEPPKSQSAAPPTRHRRRQPWIASAGAQTTWH